MKALLDTNIWIAVMRGNGKAVSRLAAMAPGDFAVSTVAVFELFVGVGKCANPPMERAKVTRFLSAMSVLSFDASVAIRAGELRAEMERNRNPVGPYDMLLAAHALSLGLALVTHDTTEFSRVNGLRLDDWL